MRDWTKAMAALLAAISSVALAQAVPAQETPEAKPAVKADDDPFAAADAKPGTDLTAGSVQVTDLNSIDLHVSDANLLDVLRALAEKTRKNIITSKSVGGKVTANLYGVTFTEALDAILHANGFAYREKGNFIYVYTKEELTNLVKSERKITTQTFKLSYVPAAVARQLITPALSGTATVAVTKESEVGISNDPEKAGGDSYAAPDVLVVNDFEDNLQAVAAILRDVDIRPQQVLIEATIVQATLKDTNSLGIDFTLLGGVDFSSVGSTNSAVLADNAIGNATGTIANGSAQASQLTPAAAFAEQGYNSVGTNIKGSNRAGLNIGLAYNNIAVFLNALESITDTNILANPKVLTVNKQPGAVIVGRKDGYITSTNTATNSVETVEFLETGTRLIFRPYIGDDGFIRMEIHPEDSTGDVRVEDGLTIPRKVTTEITANVMVKDGHTIVIGGLFREGNSITKSQVPLLGDIPLAGALFRSQTDSAERSEVIILLTPHIIKDQQTYSKASLEQMKSADLLRAGLRQGMMPWGRDRLAEMCYTKAREETSQKYYDRERAMWYLDMATNLNPMFTEALQLKESVSGKQIMESDNSSIRHFLTDLVMNEQAQVPASEPTTAPADVLVTPAPVSAAPIRETTPVVPAPTPAPAPAAPAPAPAMVAPEAAPAAPAAPVQPAAPAVKELPAAGSAGDSNK